MRTCGFDGCQDKHFAKGYCRVHYAKAKRGTLERPRAQYIDEVGTCAADDCQNTFRLRAIGSPRKYCSRTCRDRVVARKARSTGWVAPHKRPGRDACSVDGCPKPRMARGLCPMHYERFKKHGTPGEAAARVRPGEWRVGNQGYVRRTVRGKLQLQHRVVMEEHIGRPLEAFETVHHRNGRRDDNRLANLELWVRPQAAGQRVEDLVAFVVEHYPDLVRKALSKEVKSR